MSKVESITVSRWALTQILALALQCAGLLVWGTRLTDDVRHLQNDVAEVKGDVKQIQAAVRAGVLIGTRTNGLAQLVDTRARE